jgi:hypothetical protein
MCRVGITEQVNIAAAWCGMILGSAHFRNTSSSVFFVELKLIYATVYSMSWPFIGKGKVRLLK